MFTLIEGVTPWMNPHGECVCGECDANGGFPPGVERRLYRHDETGQFWAVTFLPFTQEDRENQREEMLSTASMLMGGVDHETILSRMGEPPIPPPNLSIRIFASDPEGFIPDAFNVGSFGVDYDGEFTDEEAWEKALLHLEHFYLLSKPVTGNESVPDSIPSEWFMDGG